MPNKGIMLNHPMRSVRREKDNHRSTSDTQTVRYQEFPPFKLEGHDKLALRTGKLTIRNKQENVLPPGDKPTIRVEAEKRLVPQDGGLLSGGPLRFPYLFKRCTFIGVMFQKEALITRGQSTILMAKAAQSSSAAQSAHGSQKHWW